MMKENMREETGRRQTDRKRGRERGSKERVEERESLNGLHGCGGKGQGWTRKK